MRTPISPHGHTNLYVGLHQSAKLQHGHPLVPPTTARGRCWQWGGQPLPTWPQLTQVTVTVHNHSLMIVLPSFAWFEICMHFLRQCSDPCIYLCTFNLWSSDNEKICLQWQQLFCSHNAKSFHTLPLHLIQTAELEQGVVTTSQRDMAMSMFPLTLHHNLPYFCWLDKHENIYVTMATKSACCLRCQSMMTFCVYTSMRELLPVNSIGNRIITFINMFSSSVCHCL